MRATTAILALLPLITASWVPRQASSSVASVASAASSAAAPSSSAAAPVNATSTGPKVTIYPYNSPKEGVTITGVRTPSLVTDAYLGIPFGAPPVGALRFTPPQNPTWNTSTFSATRHPPACLQRNTSSAGSRGSSEDCLYLNVFTPQGANASTAYLPVFVWVYGGGFTSGAANIYNASLLTAAGVQSKQPFISVIINYRLGFLGWPYGKEIAQNKAANLGLKDVLASLQWVQDNIWAFGGDPSRVTLGGQSAGAIAIALLHLNPDIKLFRSAILQSGGTSTAPIAPTDGAWEAVYNLMANGTGCNVTAAATGNTTTNSTNSVGNYTTAFECMKYVSADRILAAQVAVQSSLQYGGSFTFAPSIDYDLIPDSPHALIGSGQFARKPMINGNNKDEGTIFVPRAIASGQTALLLAITQPKTPSNATFARLLQLYPDDPTVGSPFGTGNETFGINSAFKQASAIIGDNAFQANRRWFIRSSRQFHPEVPVYSYFFNQTTPGAPAVQGVYHGSEVPYLFGATLAGGNYTAADVGVTTAMANYWINFIYNSNPNGNNATNWPMYGSESEQRMLQIQAGNITVIRDNYREEKIGFFNSQPEQFNLRKRGSDEE